METSGDHVAAAILVFAGVLIGLYGTQALSISFTWGVFYIAFGGAIAYTGYRFVAPDHSHRRYRRHTRRSPLRLIGRGGSVGAVSVAVVFATSVAYVRTYNTPEFANPSQMGEPTTLVELGWLTHTIFFVPLVSGSSVGGARLGATVYGWGVDMSSVHPVMIVHGVLIVILAGMIVSMYTDTRGYGWGFLAGATVSIGVVGALFASSWLFVHVESSVMMQHVYRPSPQHAILMGGVYGVIFGGIGGMLAKRLRLYRFVR